MVAIYCQVEIATAVVQILLYSAVKFELQLSIFGDHQLNWKSGSFYKDFTAVEHDADALLKTDRNFKIKNNPFINTCKF